MNQITLSKYPQKIYFWELFSPYLTSTHNSNYQVHFQSKSSFKALKHSMWANRDEIQQWIDNGAPRWTSVVVVCAPTRDPDTAMSSSVLMQALTTSSMCPYNTWTGLGWRPTGAPPCTIKQRDRLRKMWLVEERSQWSPQPIEVYKLRICQFCFWLKQ